jgi:hypothetical protein
MLRRAIAGVAATACVSLGAVTGAIAAPQADDGVLDSGEEVHEAGHQHGGTAGHLPASRENVNLIGKVPINQDLKDGRVADVGVFKKHAYLAAFYEPKCQKGGVYVVDISNPSNPKQINFIRTSNDSYVGEGVQTIHIDTPAYEGDVLAMNNEICPLDDDPDVHANGGMTLVDVTDPKRHKYLVKHAGDVQPDGSTNEIHSVFMWDVGAKAYAVLVDDEEATDVDIMDITDPRNPVMVGEYDLAEMFPQILQEGVGLDEVFFHDMVVKEIGGRQIMLASYWDAGYVALDVTDPANPTYVGDSDFTFPDPEAAESGFNVDPEGNGHQSEITLDNQYLIGADEDFNPFKVRATTDDGGQFVAVQGDDVPGIPQGGSIEGDTVYAGRACPGDPAVPAGDGTQIAVVERGVCDFQVKIDAVVAAGGYQAVLVFNRENGATEDGCDTLVTMLASSDMPSFFISRRDGFGFFDEPYDHDACLAGDGSVTAPFAVGTVGDHISMESFFDGWGYVHLYGYGAGKFAELDTYAIPEAHDPAFADGSGDLSVHEVATSPTDARLAYFSYYAGGFRVARIDESGDEPSLDEVGHFIDEGGNNFWGVQVFHDNGRELVAASDRDFGLYIFRYTGP